jgi:protein-disulfide isomerase
MKIKIVLLTLLVTLNLKAVDSAGIQHYVKQYMETKMNSPVDRIEIISHYEIPGTRGWEVYFLSLKVNIKMGESYHKRTVPQVVFTKGNKIAFSLKDGAGKDYAKTLKPKVPLDAYDANHLLIGNPNALHKVLVMSDPFCPYCQEIVPELINTVKKNPNTFALYYYHLPLLRIHPASDVTTKAMHLFQQRGEIENLKSLYHLLIDPKEKNENKILKAIKDKTGVTVTKSEINTAEIKSALAFDKAMKKRLMVTGTPTIFIDGLWDPTRMAYKKYVK